MCCFTDRTRPRAALSQVLALLDGVRMDPATSMLRKGVHPKIESERLGHSSIGITLETYSHVLPGMQEEAAQAFDRLFPGAE
jgi:hypothetical protein